MDGWGVASVFFLLFVILILYIIGSSDSKGECKTNHPELIETQAECSSKYPTQGPTTDTGSGGGSATKDECKTNYPELIETKSECLSSFPIGYSDFDMLPSCEGFIYGTPYNTMGYSCNSPLSDAGIPPNTPCSQRYLPIEDLGIAYQCVAADPSSPSGICNSWNDSVDNAIICHIPE